MKMIDVDCYSLLTPEVIDSMTTGLYEVAIEMHLDMIGGCKDDYTSFSDVDKSFENFDNVVERQMLDLVDDFKRMLRKAIANRQVVVESVEIDKEGFVNAKTIVQRIRDEEL